MVGREELQFGGGGQAGYNGGMGDVPKLEYARGVAAEGGKGRMRWRRVLAAVLDGVVVAGGVLVVMGVASDGWMSGDESLTSASFLGACGYMGVEVVGGRTLGKYLAGIAVVAREGGVGVGWGVVGRRLVRFGVKNVWLFGYTGMFVLGEWLPWLFEGKSWIGFLVQCVSAGSVLIGMALGLMWVYRMVRNPSSSIPDELAGTRVVEVGGGGGGE